MVQTEEEKNTRRSPWVLRMELDNDKMLFKDLNIKTIEKNLISRFEDQINIIVSDENEDIPIIRLRLNDIEDDDEETVCQCLKEFEDKILNEVSLKGILEIQKVTFTKY